MLSTEARARWSTRAHSALLQQPSSWHRTICYNYIHVIHAIYGARYLLRASFPSSSAKARGSKDIMLWPVSRSLVGHDNTSTRRRSCRVSMLLYAGC